MQPDPKPELSAAALDCNMTYWQAKAKEAAELLRQAYENESKIYDSRNRLNQQSLDS